MKIIKMLTVAAFFAAVLFVAASVQAAWSDNMIISNAPNHNGDEDAIADGNGGAIISWHDNRNGNYDIYAQKVNAKGEVQWTGNGVAVTTNAADQVYPKLISDGSGGAIIAWEDHRNPSFDIYAQKINSDGVLQWADNGVPIVTEGARQDGNIMISDNAGGSIIIWRDDRNGNSDIYAQRINSSGVVQWAENGRPIVNESSNQSQFSAIFDNSDGVIVVWQDNRNLLDDVYAQKINFSGESQWTTNGVAIRTGSGSQSGPKIDSDGSNGAIIVWTDTQDDTNYDIYAQRINSSGATQWASGGVILNSPSVNFANPQIVYDGTGGTIVTWMRNYGASTDIYAQKINSSGETQWTSGGKAVSAATGSQELPVIASDGLGNSIIGWNDNRNGANFQIYGQKYNSSGEEQWTSGGLAIASYYLVNLGISHLIYDEAGGAVAIWSGGNIIYAQRIYTTGALGGSDNTAPVTAVLPKAGSYFSVKTVTLTAADETGGSGVYATYHTIDGSTPSISSSKYSSPLAISKTTTLKFFSVDNAGNSESVKTKKYTLPIFFVNKIKLKKDYKSKILYSAKNLFGVKFSAKMPKNPTKKYVSLAKKKISMKKTLGYYSLVKSNYSKKNNIRLYFFYTHSKLTKKKLSEKKLILLKYNNATKKWTKVKATLNKKDNYLMIRKTKLDKSDRYLIMSR